MTTRSTGAFRVVDLGNLEAAVAIAGYLAVAMYAAVWIFDAYVFPAVKLGVPLPESLLAFLVSVGILAAGLSTYWVSKGAEAGKLFLWASSMGSISILGGLVGRYYPQIDRVYFAAIAMLAAFLVGFHAAFPPRSFRMKSIWTAAYCVVASGLALSWLSGHDGIDSSRLEYVTYGVLALSVAFSIARMWNEGYSNEVEDYRWAGRALSVVLTAGAGFIAIRGWVLPWVTGKPMLPLWTVYLTVSAVVAGYAYVLLKLSPWQDKPLVSRTFTLASALAVLAPPGFLLFWFLSAIVGDLASAAVTLACLLPLYWLVSKGIDDLIYGGWYKHETLVENVISGLSGGKTFSDVLDRSAELLRDEMKLEEVCLREKGEPCWCWDGEWKKSDECVEEYVLSFGESELVLSRHIDGSGFSKKDRWALKVIGGYLKSLGTHSPGYGVDSEPCPLTPREIDVLELIGEGLSNKEIAQRLFVSIKTVEHHITSIYRKMGVDGRVQAVVKAERNGWIDTRKVRRNE